MKKARFKVSGMTCSACSSHVEKAASKVDGIKKVNVNLLLNSMDVEYDPSELRFPDDIINAVGQAGYNAELEENINGKVLSTDTKGVTATKDDSKIRLIVSFCFLIPLLYLSMGHMMNFPLPSFFHGVENAITFSFTQFLLTLPIAMINYKYFYNGFYYLFKKQPNMDSLIAVGSSAALLYGIYAIYQIGIGLGQNDIELVERFTMDLYFESAATILTLITFGKFLENRAKGKTSEAITKLINLRPQTATILVDGKEKEISIDEININDVVIIKQGQTIPVDGLVIKGTATVDESAVTGESIPVEKRIGTSVISGSINKSGYLQFKATKVGSDTTLSQIIKLVEEASSTKAPIAKLADKISGIFVPVVISIAILAVIVWLILGYGFEFALSIGISVLVISCPCALGLATPTAIMVGTGKGATQGILIKSADSLETAHKINTVVLDKTGTVTKGTPTVTDIIPTNNVSENKLLQIAASLEKLSEHPLADAIIKKSEENHMPMFTVKNFSSMDGLGISGEIDNKKILAGNRLLMQNENIDIGIVEKEFNKLASNGKTPMFFAINNTLAGIIAVSDVIKTSSPLAIKNLQSMGIKVIMLTGDNETTAQAIAKEVNVDKVISGVLPQEKEAEVRKLQAKGNVVAMVGDGINDSPALVRADVGVAIGAGTDIAIESADIVLVKSDLNDVPKMIQLSRSTMRNIKENLFWALIYNTIGIPLAAGVFYLALGWRLTPMFAAAAMSLSSVCVVLNALRLRTFKPKLAYIQEEQTEESKNKMNETENKGEAFMKTKTIKIEGMSCEHCSARVETVLNEIDGVTAKVNLEEKTATVELSKEITDDALSKTIANAGYTVVEIK